MRSPIVVRGVVGAFAAGLLLRRPAATTGAVALSAEAVSRATGANVRQPGELPAGLVGTATHIRPAVLPLQADWCYAAAAAALVLSVAAVAVGWHGRPEALLAAM